MAEALDQPEEPISGRPGLIAITEQRVSLRASNRLSHAVPMALGRPLAVQGTSQAAALLGISSSLPDTVRLPSLSNDQASAGPVRRLQCLLNAQ